MAKLNIAEQIIASTLKLGTPKPYLDRGWDMAWMKDPYNIYRAAVFPEPYGNMWRFILDYWDRYSKVPPAEVFKQGFPTFAYPEEIHTPDELVDLAGNAIKTVI